MAAGSTIGTLVGDSEILYVDCMDGQTVKLKRSLIPRFKTLNKMIQNLPNPNTTRWSLLTDIVKAEWIKKIIEWIEHYPVVTYFEVII